MKFNEFAEKIKKVYAEKFAWSACKVKPFICLGNSLYIDCYLSENENECSYGYLDNDMFKISFLVGLPDTFDFEADELPENLVMTSLNNHYAIKPEDDCYYCSNRKIPYRKTTGTAEKLITVFGKFTDKLYNQLMEDIKDGNIHPNYETLLKQKI